MRACTERAVLTVLASPSLKMAISTLSTPLTRVISSRSLAPRSTSATSLSRTLPRLVLAEDEFADLLHRVVLVHGADEVLALLILAASRPEG